MYTMGLSALASLARMSKPSKATAQGSNTWSSTSPFCPPNGTTTFLPSPRHPRKQHEADVQHEICHRPANPKVLPGGIPESDPAEEDRGRNIEEARAVIEGVRSVGSEFRVYAEISGGCFARRWAYDLVVLAVRLRLPGRRVWRSGRCPRGV